MRVSILLWFKFKSTAISAISDNLSKALQKESVSALSGFYLAELIVKTCPKMRADEEAELFFKTVSKKALDYPFINKAALPRKRKRPNYGSLDNYFQVERYSNSTNTYHPTTPEQYFRQQHFENLDLIISSIKDRFNQRALTAYLKMEQLLLNIILSNNYEDELAYVFNVYKGDIDPMQVQTEVFSMSTMFRESNCKEFSDIIEHVESLHPTKCAPTPNCLTIVYLILINSATSCTPERSSSVA